MLAVFRRPLVLVLLAVVIVAAVGGVIWYQATPHTTDACLAKSLKMPHETDDQIDAMAVWQTNCIERVGG